MTGHIIKQKITGNYEIIQKKMGALYVNYLQKKYLERFWLDI